MAIDPLIIRGRIVTFDKQSRVIDDGVLYVGADESITAIRKAGQLAPEGFEPARVLDTGGSVYPGLIDLHNHIVYNALPLWASPTRSHAWLRRGQCSRAPWGSLRSWSLSIRRPTRPIRNAAPNVCGRRAVG